MFVCVCICLGGMEERGKGRMIPRRKNWGDGGSEGLVLRKGNLQRCLQLYLTEYKEKHLINSDVYCKNPFFNF